MHFDGELEPCFFTFDKRQPLYLDVRDTQGMGWLFSIHAENYQAWGLKTINLFSGIWMSTQVIVWDEESLRK